MFIDDVVFLNSHQDIYLRVFSPTQTFVVAGSSNDIKKEVYINNCQKDSVNIFRRSGGGGAVVLDSNCVVVSLGLWMKDYFANKKYFCKINQALISSMGQKWKNLLQLSQKGLSDICFLERKLVGTSLFRSRNYLLYQASIIYKKNIASINRYLPHPSKEPEYRDKKNHSDFLTSVLEITTEISKIELVLQIKNTLKQNLYRLLAEDLISSIDHQSMHLKRRASQNKGSILLAKDSCDDLSV